MSRELVKEVSDIANDLLESEWGITPLEALTLATKIQHNRVLSDGLCVGENYPSALESIAMALGYSNDSPFGSIKQSLNEIAAAIAEKEQ